MPLPLEVKQGGLASFLPLSHLHSVLQLVWLRDLNNRLRFKKILLDQPYGAKTASLASWCVVICEEGQHIENLEKGNL